MSVSVSMPQLGESVTEGTVTRWLKKEGERVEVDEPLLEVSTDKVDTEIPSPASGVLRGISVDEDETVAVGAQLAVIDDGASGDAAPGADDSASAAPAEAAQPAAAQADSAQADSAQADSAQADSAQADPASAGPARFSPARFSPARRSPARADAGQLGRLEPAGIAAELRAARAVLPRCVAGLSGLVRALDARLRSAARVRAAAVVPALRPARPGRRRAPGGRVGSCGSRGRPRPRSTRRLRRCPAPVTRRTSPRWSASWPPSTRWT